MMNSNRRSRRWLLRRGALCLGLSLAWPVARLVAAAPGGLPEGIGVQPDFIGPLPTRRLGEKPAFPEEENTARQILAKCPKGPTPYATAQYFLQVSRGVYGSAWQPYAKGWPSRWNPMIVQFFTATKSTPSGDVTPWCSAFVNWCFLQAGYGEATTNASSGSFKCFSTVAVPPKEGDVVVFKRPDPSASSCSGRGHVGFFVRDLGATVEVLGGNQIDSNDGCHEISVKPLAKEGVILTLESYRSVVKAGNSRGTI
jgi:uncharacterized protein (TIGR02594 family)